jgi:hypothetical protein
MGEFARCPLPWTFRACKFDESWEIVDSDGDTVLAGHDGDGPFDSRDAYRVVRCVNALDGRDPCEVDDALYAMASRKSTALCVCAEQFDAALEGCCEEA